MREQGLGGQSAKARYSLGPIEWQPPVRTVAMIVFAMAVVILTPFIMFWIAIGTQAFFSILIYGLPR